MNFNMNLNMIKNSMGNINSNHVILLTIIVFILFQFYSIELSYNDFGIFVAIGLVGFVVTKDLFVSVFVAMVATYIWRIIVLGANRIRVRFEGFTDKHNTEESNEESTTESEEDSIEESIEESTEESIKKSSKKSANVAVEESMEEDDMDNFEDISINTGETVREVYKNMTPSQVSGLNNDTQALIATQKKLMETLNNMGPTLNQSKKILDTFKNYFGDSDLSALKNLKL